VLDFTVSDLFQSYYDCRKTKRNTWNARLFEEHLEKNLMDLYYDLKNDKYKIGRSICFIVDKPKLREIWAADFRDRIVHHLLYNKIRDRFHNSFIHDSYACIPGKGTHRAVDRAEQLCRQLTQDYKEKAYFLKIDVANYFVSINKVILSNLIAKKVHEPEWLKLCNQILFHDPTKNVYVKSDPQLLTLIPPHKSLFTANGNGLPIGNLSSQFFANIYLNELDQYAKHVLKIKYMVRYVDDVVIFDKDPKKLYSYIALLNDYAQENLKIHFHPNKIEINSLDVGFKMLGFVIRPRVRYIRQETAHRAKNKIKMMCERQSPKQEVRAVANSYLGIFGQANSWVERKKLAIMMSQYGWWFSPKLDKVILRKGTT
jgi:RNA-directed DNA polymerase